MERKDVALALETPAEPIWVDADPTRLVQVFGNLLDNAANSPTPAGRSR